MLKTRILRTPFRSGLDIFLRPTPFAPTTNKSWHPSNKKMVSFMLYEAQTFPTVTHFRSNVIDVFSIVLSVSHYM